MQYLTELELSSAIRRGIERECLRVSPNGEIAMTPHPRALGSSLTHPHITTDYSEALLEFVTPVFQDPQKLLEFLKDLHVFTLKHIGREIFWNNSMPCLLKKDTNIPIAYYGKSNIGKMKTTYRKGLYYRYGSAMQVISGIHFNFSLTDECFEKLSKKDRFQGELQDYKSQKYMAAIRNLHKYSWLVPYILGSSPTICQSFLCKAPKIHDLTTFDQQGTLSYAGATSLRLSDIGYTNKGQSQVNLCYNSLKNYIEGLRHAVITSDPNWEKIGIKDGNQYKQLNSNILQLENEYYSGVRPKRRTLSGERPLNALASRGIEYIELRSMDVNSFSPIGIELEQILFLDVFLLYCILAQDEKHDRQTTKEYRKNQEMAARHGRKKGITLFRSGTRILLLDWAKELFEHLLEIAELLNGQYQYAKVINNFQNALFRPNLLYSAKLENEMREKNETFFHNMLNRSKDSTNYLQSQTLCRNQEKHLTNISKQSLQDQKEIEKSDHLPFDSFLAKYFQ